MTASVVALDVPSLRAHGFTPGDLTHAPVGTVLVAADGTPLRVTAEGALDPVRPFGRRSIASDPAARRGDMSEPSSSQRIGSADPRRHPGPEPEGRRLTIPRQPDTGDIVSEGAA